MGWDARRTTGRSGRRVCALTAVLVVVAAVSSACGGVKEPSADGPLTTNSYCNAFDHAGPDAQRSLAAQVYQNAQGQAGNDSQVASVLAQLSTACTDTLLHLPKVTATINYQAPPPPGEVITPTSTEPSDDGTEDDSGGVDQTPAPAGGTASVTNRNGFTFTVSRARVAYSQDETDLGYGIPEIWGTMTNTENQNGLPPSTIGAALTTTAYAKLRVTTLEGGPSLPPDDSLNVGPCVHPVGQPGWCILATGYFDTENDYALTEYGYTGQDPIPAHTAQTFLTSTVGYQELPVSLDLASNAALIYANEPLTPAEQSGDAVTAIPWTLIP